MRLLALLGLAVALLAACGGDDDRPATVTRAEPPTTSEAAPEPPPDKEAQEEPELALVEVASGLESPVHVAGAPGEKGRLYIVEQAGHRATVHPSLADAADAAREWAASSDRRAVVIAGSVVLAGEAIALAEEEDWKSGWRA